MAKSAKAILEFYSSVLSGVNIHQTGDGHLSLKLPSGEGSAETPCISNGKRLSLPTTGLLKVGDFEGILPFHPLSENLLRGESEVIKFMRKMIKFRLATVSAQLLTELMDIAADTNKHAELSPRQAEYLTLVPNANEKCKKVLGKVLNKHFDEILNVYLKRSGNYCGDEFRRVASVSFPIYDELISEGSKIYDVDTGSQKNKKTIAALFLHVFPNAQDPDEWSAGSDNNVAPYLHSLLLSFANVATQLNKFVTKYRKFLDYPEILKTNTSWIEGLNNLDKWKGVILPLPGNEGNLRNGGDDSEDTAVVGKPNFLSKIAAVAGTHTSNAEQVPALTSSVSVPVLTTPTKLTVETPTVSKPVEEPKGHGISWGAMTANRLPPQQHVGYQQQRQMGPDTSHLNFNSQPTNQWNGGGGYQQQVPQMQNNFQQQQQSGYRQSVPHQQSGHRFDNSL